MTDQKLHITFDQKSHPTLTLNDLEPKTTIRDVKNKVYHHTGFVKDKMELRFGSTVLDDSKTLGDYRILNNSHVTFKGYDAMAGKMV